VSQISYQVNRPTKNRNELQKEVDRILDKINTSGFSSLDDTEREMLDKAKELLNR
jgi:CRISPR/Cas system CSM-associated protein Csm2 small subunit